MKKLNLFIAVLFLTLTACSSDDDGGNTVSSNIVGTWEMTDYTLSGTSDITEGGQTISSLIAGKGFDFNHSVTFTENPNNFMLDGSFSVEIITTTQGETETDIEEAVEIIGGDKGLWEIINGELMTTADNGEIVIMKIEELNASSLTVSANEQIDISFGGAILKSNIDVLIRFKRQ